MKRYRLSCCVLGVRLFGASLAGLLVAACGSPLSLGETEEGFADTIDADDTRASGSTGAAVESSEPPSGTDAENNSAPGAVDTSKDDAGSSSSSSSSSLAPTSAAMGTGAADQEAAPVTANSDAGLGEDSNSTSEAMGSAETTSAVETPGPEATPVSEVASGCDGAIQFPDPFVESMVRAAIGKPTGDIYQADVLDVTSLSNSGSGVTDLSGLECLINLTSLDRHQYRRSVRTDRPEIPAPGRGNIFGHLSTGRARGARGALSFRSSD
jgi:hypothetical protein